MSSSKGITAIFAGIDPSQRKSALCLIVRGEGAPDTVTCHSIRSIIDIEALIDVLGRVAEGVPKDRVFIALEYPTGAWGSRTGMAVVRAAAAAFESALARYRLKSRVTRVAPATWHSELGVSAMKVDPAEDREATTKLRARTFAMKFVVGGRDDLSQDEYDAACLAEYARRVLSKRVDAARKRTVR